MPITTDKNLSHLVQETGLITAHVPLANKNWFKTGGVAQLYAAPTNALEFQAVLSFAHTTQTPLFLLGEGANMLISDAGFDGLVIHPQLKQIKRYPLDETHDLVEAQAGVRLPELISWCLEQNLIGLEEFSGIPGTVGGSVFINVHYFEFLLSQFLVSAQVIHKGSAELLVVDNQWFNFGYNYSRLHEGDYYLVSATFKLKKVDTADAYLQKGAVKK